MLRNKKKKTVHLSRVCLSLIQTLACVSPPRAKRADSVCVNKLVNQLEMSGRSVLPES